MNQRPEHSVSQGAWRGGTPTGLRPEEAAKPRHQGGRRALCELFWADSWQVTWRKQWAFGSCLNRGWESSETKKGRQTHGEQRWFAWEDLTWKEWQGWPGSRRSHMKFKCIRCSCFTKTVDRGPRQLTADVRPALRPRRPEVCSVLSQPELFSFMWVLLLLSSSLSSLQRDVTSR